MHARQIGRGDRLPRFRPLLGLYLRIKLNDTAKFERPPSAGEVSQSPIKDAPHGSHRQIIWCPFQRP